jgi:hypothetical protein
LAEIEWREASTQDAPNYEALKREHVKLAEEVNRLRQNSPPHIHNPHRNIKTQKSHREEAGRNEAENFHGFRPNIEFFLNLTHNSFLVLCFL